MTQENEVDRRINENLETSLATLSRLVASPSISSQNIGIQETAHLMATILEEYGFTSQVMQTPAFPMVYGEAAGRADRTLICYNHYDVQPAEPLDLWDSPPFELTRKDGRLYGRGVADDKGHIVSRLAALSALRDSDGLFPCRIKFLIEGGEEVSSPHVPEFIRENLDLLKADACVWETGGVDYNGRPNMMLGMRGILYVQYTVRTMARDAHSGSAHLLPNAAWRLVRALATLKDENERVLVPGFYNHAHPISEIDRDLLDRLDLDDEATKASYGVDRFLLNLSGSEAKKAVYSPTANIAGMSAGYEGLGPKTVIPSTAMAKMDFRLVPDQDPVDLLAKLRKHLDDQGFDDVEIENLGGEAAAQTPADEPFVQLAIKSAEEVYGLPARITPLIGGSGPMHPFREYLKVPIVTVGVGHPDSRVHAPNENILLENFVSGTKHMARLVRRFATLQ